MSHEILQYPEGVYPGEANAECPAALPVIDVLLRTLQAEGPSPDGYQVKTLGKDMGGLWQINLKVKKQQVRILYAPYGKQIVLFRIHKKTSPQEQVRAYELAKTRKREFDSKREKQKPEKNPDAKSRTLH